MQPSLQRAIELLLKSSVITSNNFATYPSIASTPFQGRKEQKSLEKNHSGTSGIGLSVS